MTVGLYGGYSGYNAYSAFSGGARSAGAVGSAGAGTVGSGAGSVGAGAAAGVRLPGSSTGVKAGGMNTEGMTDAQVKSLKRAGVVECSTCASRQYKDGSDEADVSFKAAAHIDPSASASRVMAHEQEHVNNAYQKASAKGGEVVSASVTVKNGVCPECGRSYTAGGVTNSVIKYPKDSAYGANQKSMDYAAMVGKNFDIGV